MSTGMSGRLKFRDDDQRERAARSVWSYFTPQGVSEKHQPIVATRTPAERVLHLTAWAIWDERYAEPPSELSNTLRLAEVLHHLGSEQLTRVATLLAAAAESPEAIDDWLRRNEARDPWSKK